ncbi:nucleotide pyrophosphatase/phosphodiesterase family protein [Microbacterium sp.]|uniref:alkaline phosphatase family protein n=1 Tax=Microbacterium sp. TaxID=51671 RepID=UPI002E2F211C|nr:nucleotide pyrophosphatase/phosphodiesterase family protein [Microbacterium sp.]HEX5727915.1 nucleotide pyrophosphatase/phosphodiesterase family protein [Microbacterium sp.]
MSLSLPADPPRARSLTGVVPQMVAALDGTSDWFAPARSAIVFVIDGLGAHNLNARAGHARFLSSAAVKKDAARTVFPSTTASALTSLLTGAGPGEHGILGYRVLVPELGEVVNQLRGWDTDGLDPAWQRAEPLTEKYAADGRPCFIVSKGEYADTGFTSAIMRGAEFVPAEDIAERLQIAADLAARHPGAFVYTYVPDLDALGHKRGWQSDEWVNALERVDAATRAFAGALLPGTGAVVTADHGMVDVPRHRHVLLSDDDELVAGVRHIGGEPRMLHLYAEPEASKGVLARWRASESGRSWVLSRSEAVDAGLFGPVAAAVLPRIGDVVVAARSGIAYYDDRLEDKGAQRMVGQHGSLTNEERTVPLIRLGAFA